MSTGQYSHRTIPEIAEKTYIYTAHKFQTEYKKPLTTSLKAPICRPVVRTYDHWVHQIKWFQQSGACIQSRFINEIKCEAWMLSGKSCSTLK